MKKTSKTPEVRTIFFAILCFLTAFGLTWLMAGCTQNFDSVPYSITKPVYRSGEYRNLCKTGGIFVDFLNKDSRRVKEITFCFTAESNDSNLFISGNTIKHTVTDMVDSGKKKSLCIPLDKYVYATPADDLEIDPFYVYEIIFEDGSAWHDRFGMYVQ